MSVPMDFTNIDEFSSSDSEEDDDSEGDDDSEEEDGEEEDEGEMEEGGEAAGKKRNHEEEEEAEEDKDSDTVDDSDDSDDDDDDDDVDEELLLSEISSLKSVLTASPYHYESHASLIEAYRKCGDLDSLRAARESMAELFPLTPTLWKEWIADERRIVDESRSAKVENNGAGAEDGAAAATRSPRVAIAALFERAVSDYVSVDVWSEFCSFAIGSGSAEETRKIFDRALDAVRLHVTAGWQIWESYREFEIINLSLLKRGGGGGGGGGGGDDNDEIVSSELSKKIEAQTDRVTKLFERQLKIPHSNMDQTMRDYEEWLRIAGKGGKGGGVVEDRVKKDFIEAKKRLTPLQKLEDELAEAEDAAGGGGEETESGPSASFRKSGVYQKYIDYELSQDSPGRIQLIFERAIAENPLEANLWLRFGDYLDLKLKAFDLSSSLYKRSVRNCSWNAELWRRLLVGLERRAVAKDEMDGVYVKALTGGFTTAAEYGVVVGAYLDYMRRRCGKIEKRGEEGGKAIEDDALRLFRGAFDQAIDFLSTVADSADEIVRVCRYGARFEAMHCGHMELARKFWTERIFPLGYNVNYNLQMEFINLERAHGTVKHCRRHFHKALNSVSQMDYPEELFEAYLSFEREEGSLEEETQAREFVVKQRKMMKEREEKKAAKDAKETEKRGVKGGGRMVVGKGGGGNVGRGEAAGGGGRGGGGGGGGVSAGGKNKRPYGIGGEAAEKRNGVPAKKIKGNSTDPPGSRSSSSSSEDVFKVPQLPPMATSKFSAAKNSKTAPKTDSKLSSTTETAPTPLPSAPPPPVDEALEKRDRTVFVSNMNFRASEDDLRDAFKFCGGISSIRLVVDAKTGKGRGFGYVEFVQAKGAEAALKMDRFLVKDRPLYVSKVKEKGAKSEKKFQFTTGLEPRKLFVKNLPLVSNEDTLKTMFSSHGEVVQVRLVTMKSGKSKGMAYVEFATEEQAKKAMLQTDGMMVGENKIEVAISNTPARKEGEGGGGAGGTVVVAAPDDSAMSSKPAEAVATAPHLGGGKKETLERGKARTQVALVPRAALKPKMTAMMMPRSLKAKAPAAAAAPTPAVAPAVASASSDSGVGEEMDVDKNEVKSEGKKSNADFRSMFFK